jgi:FkbM family methyltransferase
MTRTIDAKLRKCQGVIHVGANSGQERKAYAKARLSVVWVEPIPAVFAGLEANISSYPSQRAVRALLTDVDGAEYNFKIANNGGASSSIFDFKEHKDIWPHVYYTSEQPMRSTTLASLLARENIDPKQYSALVMDVQGAELLVLKGAGERLREFAYVKAEAADFESYAGCCTLADLSSYLERFGFVESDRKKFASHPNGGRYWDVTWIRASHVEPPAKGIWSIMFGPR